MKTDFITEKQLKEVLAHYRNRSMQSLKSVKNEFYAFEDGKKSTIRKGHRDIRLGLLMFGSEEPNVNLEKIVNVTQVVHCKVKDLPVEYAKLDDFQDKHDLVNQLSLYYPDINEETEITAIVFEDMDSNKKYYK